MPMAHLRLVELPAEVDLVPVAQRREVDHPRLEVADQEVQRFEMFEAQRRGHCGLRACAPRVRTADDVGERREARVEALVLEHPLGLLQAANGAANLRKESVGLL